MFFPTEAKLAMEIAHAETTSGLASLLSSRGSSGNLMEVDLNETPITRKKRLISKIETLSRTGITNSYFFSPLHPFISNLQIGFVGSFLLVRLEKKMI